ncbi:MFS transporter [Candidatus Falkowbacteria bacterium]|nr:MFS transporter [Candidatus Falkowbacteria bacterium]
MLPKKQLATIFAIIATEIVGFGLIIPVLPQIAMNFEATAIEIGWLVSIYSLMQFVATPVLGYLSDIYGRKRLLIISQIGTLISYIMLILAHQYWLLFISRMLDGITGGNISVARAYITDIIPKEERPRGMAVIGMAFGLGFFVGPFLGSIVFALGYSFTLVALIAAGLSLTALTMTMVFIKEPVQHVQREKPTYNFIATLKHPAVGYLLAGHLLFFTVVTGYQSTLAIFTSKFLGFDEAQNSMLFAIIGLSVLVAQGSIATRGGKNHFKMLFVGAGIFLTSLLLLGFFPTAIMLFVVGVVKSFGHALVGSFLPAIIANVRKRDSDGELMGIYESIISISRVIGPLIFTALFVFGPQLSMTIMSCVGVVGVVFFRLGERKIKSLA